MLDKIRKWFFSSSETRNIHSVTTTDESTANETSTTSAKKDKVFVDQLLDTEHVEQLIRQRVRIKPDDCLGCKIVSTVTVTFFFGVISSLIPKVKTKLPSHLKTVGTYGQYGSLLICKYISQ